jgi:hypothetical protein
MGVTPFPLLLPKPSPVIKCFSTRAPNFGAALSNDFCGPLTSEQLWVLPLRSKDGFDLDAVAIAASKRLKLIAEEESR